MKHKYLYVFLVVLILCMLIAGCVSTKTGEIDKGTDTVLNSENDEVNAGSDETDSEKHEANADTDDANTENKENSENLDENKDKESPAKENVAKVILIAGQSNAVGATVYAPLKDKAPDKYPTYKKGYENVKLAYFCEAGGANGAQKSYRCNFDMDGCNKQDLDDVFQKVKTGMSWTPSMFGPELGMAEYLSENYPDETFYLIKVAKGGVSIPSHWKEGGYCYELLQDTMEICMGSLENAGYTPEIISICWMQGENDATNDAETAQYADNLAFIADEWLREEYKEYAPAEGIPFVDAGISDYWKNYKEINQIKKDFAESSNINYYFDTMEEGLEYDSEPEGNVDLAHFDSLSVLELGRLFAEYCINAYNNL